MPLRWGLGLALLGMAVIAAAIVFWPQDEQTERERFVAAVREFQEIGNGMTPVEVRRSFGEPDEVFRNNPRALCWAYHAPYEVRMCWGPKRRSAWIATNVPLRSESPSG
jgi:hypothetical protein